MHQSLAPLMLLSNIHCIVIYTTSTVVISCITSVVTHAMYYHCVTCTSHMSVLIVDEEVKTESERVLEVDREDQVNKAFMLNS